MKRITAILVLMGALLMSGCNFTGLKIVTGSGVIAEETRQVSGFDAVVVDGSADVIITQGDKEGVTIEAEENILPYIRTDVRGHTLHIYIDHRDLLTVNARRPMKFHVFMKDITGLDLSGSGTISSDKITAENLDIDISGAGDLNIDELSAAKLTVALSGSGDIAIDSLKADSLKLDISGAGECILNGEAASQSLTISGSGKCDNSGLKSKDVAIDISGAGSVHVNAENTLDVTISGSGDLTYSGRPRITQEISGSGSITAVD